MWSIFQLHKYKLDSDQVSHDITQKNMLVSCLKEADKEKVISV